MICVLFCVELIRWIDIRIGSLRLMQEVTRLSSSTSILKSPYPLRIPPKNYSLLSNLVRRSPVLPLPLVLMRKMLDLQEQLGSAAAAFPPLLISSSLSTLLAETYVSSHPLSALILHNPPSSVVLAKLHEQRDDLFRTKLDEFTYEPRFAIAVMKAAMEGEGERSRLEKEFNVEDDSQVTTLVGGLDRAGFAVAMEWMDDNGL